MSFKISEWNLHRICLEGSGGRAQGKGRRNAIHRILRMHQASARLVRHTWVFLTHLLINSSDVTVFFSANIPNPSGLGLSCLLYFPTCISQCIIIAYLWATPPYWTVKPLRVGDSVFPVHSCSPWACDHAHFCRLFPGCFISSLPRIHEDSIKIQVSKDRFR